MERIVQKVSAVGKRLAGCLFLALLPFPMLVTLLWAVAATAYQKIRFGKVTA